MAIDQHSIDLLATIQMYGGILKKMAGTEGGEWKGPCPKCGGTDRFTVQPNYGNNGGRWSCRQCSPQWGDTVGFIQFIDGLGFLDACEKLGLKWEGRANGNGVIPSVDLSQAPTPKPSKRIYADLADYARKHGVEPHVFTAWGWRDGKHNNRPCIVIPGHDDGIDRVRMIDRAKAEFMPVVTGGRQRCLYGWEKAITLTGQGRDLVLCNGQPSVVVAQYYNIPAIAQTDGEAALEPRILEQLVAQLQTGTKLIIALDGDEPGRTATAKIKEQLQAYDVATVDFGGNAGYDLGDFAAANKDDAYKKLRSLMQVSRRAPEQIVSLGDLTTAFDAFMDDDKFEDVGEAVMMPFKSMHRLGGMAQMLPPGKMTAVVGGSGDGKTTFQETMRDALLKAGYDCLWYSPEWDTYETHWRIIQRNGGATTGQA